MNIANRSSVSLGMVWLALATTIGKVSGLVSLIVAGRFIDKADFAVFAFCTGSAAIFSSLKNSGIQRLLIQHNRHYCRIIGTAMTYCTAINLLAAAGTVAVVSLSIGLYPSSDVLTIAILLAFSILASTTAPISQSNLSAKLDFVALAKIRIYSQLAKMATTVAFSLAKIGYLALTLPVIVATATESLLSWISAGPTRPTFRFRRRIACWIILRSLPIQVVTTLTAVALNLDIFLLGRYLAPTTLADYFFAAQLTVSFGQLVTSSLRGVMMPSFVSLRLARRDITLPFLRSLRLLAFSTMLAVAVLALAAPLFVSATWGDKWTTATPLVALLSGAILPRVVVSLYRSLLEAEAQWSMLAVHVAIDILAVCLSAYVALRWDCLELMAASVVLLGLAHAVIQTVTISRVLGLPMSSPLLIIATPFTAIALCTAIFLAPLIDSNAVLDYRCLLAIVLTMTIASFAIDRRLLGEIQGTARALMTRRVEAP